MRRFYNPLAVFILALAFLFLPKAVFAASLFFAPAAGPIKAGDVFVMPVMVDAQGQKINVAEGSINFDSNLLEIHDITTGGSIFNTWTRQPIFSNQTGKITFTGGTTEAFSGSQGQVLKIVFFAKQPGQAYVNFSIDSALFLADGKGTKISPHLNNGSVAILNPPQNGGSNSQWNNILDADKTPPQNLNIALGKDSSVFDGKYFISFWATDSDSGIGHYEVKEGSGEFAQTESPYVLNDQTLSGVVTVKVFDKSGNIKTETLNLSKAAGANANYRIWVMVIIGIILAIILLSLAVKKIKKQKK